LIFEDVIVIIDAVTPRAAPHGPSSEEVSMSYKASFLVGSIAAILSVIAYVLISFANSYQELGWGSMASVEFGPADLLVPIVAFALGFFGTQRTARRPD
jgi:ABC-type Fe3+ transport system permease subunit